MGRALLPEPGWNQSQKIESFTLFKPGHLLCREACVTLNCSIKGSAGDLVGINSGSTLLPFSLNRASQGILGSSVN